jgi:DHA2 family multidrug resistance protein-like MFS transporter
MHADGLPSPRRAFAFSTIILVLTVAVMDGSIVNVALPTIAREFNTSPAASVWIVNAYQLAIVVSLLPLAALGEIHGYRKVYLAGILLFAIASAGCALSNSLPMLTAARVAQGFGAAGIMAVNSALIRYIFPRARLGQAIGWNAMAVAAASTIGPTFGGAILSIASWHWLFVFNVPLGIAGFVIGCYTLPDSDRTVRKFDLVNTLLTAAMIGLLITSLDSIGHGVAWPLLTVQVGAGVLAAVLLTRRELHRDAPMLPLDLLRKPIFALSVCTSVASFGAQMTAFVALPFLLQGKFGFAPLEIGLLMMPWPLAIGAMAPLAGRLSDRYSSGLLGSAGMVLMTLGLLSLAWLPANPSNFDILWRMLIGGIGFGLFQTPNNRTLINSAPRTRSGAASGMLGSARLTGQAVGAAIVGLVLARFGIEGVTIALYCGAASAGMAAIVSLLRTGSFAREPPAAESVAAE